MTSFRTIKFATAFLAIVFLMMSLVFIRDSLFHSEVPKTPGYVIAVAGETSGGETKPAEPAGPAYEPIEALLASADAAAGEKVFKKCAACHTSEKGGAFKTGPNLWNVVGLVPGSYENFKYSAAMVEFGKSKAWNYEELNGFLYKPKAFIKGTKMSFGGLKKTKDRANLILFLRGLSDSPAALPGS